MPESPAQPHMLSDFRLEQLTYRIFLLSPFEILEDQQLATTWKTILYMLIMLLAYATLRISFWLQFQDNGAYKFLSANGNLWMFTRIFDFIVSSLSFGVVILNGLSTNTHQIQYFQELHNVDIKLFTSFGVVIKRSRIRIASNVFLVLGLFYYFGYFFGSLSTVGSKMLTPYQKFASNFTSYFDCILNLIIALFYVNCTQMCRERLSSVRILLRHYSNFSTEQMDAVLQLYVRIRGLIFLINRFMGFMVLLKIAHDFILASSIVYEMCSSLYSAKELVDYLELLSWLVEVAIGPILMTLTAEMLSTEVYYSNLMTIMLILVQIYLLLLRLMIVLKYYPV